jgi:hypothetical protein
VRLASGREYAGVTGRYFYKEKLSRPNPLAEDDDNAAQLWRATAELADIDDGPPVQQRRPAGQVMHTYARS